ncbi:hypothetical protein VTK73DRAFT_10067 [Phialemonium thermophilum]|uniref:DUF8021 domain-containing protein n=1 Tax=Phialemonium thermophilum TaxID=223376 RepID=A0ABR3VYU6_9PEZI
MLPLTGAAYLAVCAWSALALLPSVLAAVSCDRACLEGHISDFLAALAAHDPSTLPTTEDVTYVENGQTLPLGTGEWLVAGPPGKYRHTFSDPDAGQVGTITTLTENGVAAIYIVRLKLEPDGRISQIETQITRDPGGAALYEKMGQPEAVWLEAVPRDQRLPRETLIQLANRYYTGMQRNDPRGNYSFFDQDCNRLEDGLQTTNVRSGDAYGHSNDTVFASLGCEAQFQTGFLGFVTRIRDRRFPVVDEERQAVLAMTILDHNGTVRVLPDVNGTSSPIPPYFDVPRTLAATEGFRLRGDKLFRIEMTLIEVPYGMRSAFPGRSQGALSSPGTNGTTTKNPCDRECLLDVVGQVLQALLAHDHERLPLARGAKYSENGQFLAFGDGLWETASSLARLGDADDDAHAYAAHFADPATGTAAYWGLSREQTTPGVLALRIKVHDGQIAEIEAVDVRAESNGARGGSVTLMRPPLPVEWDGRSLGRLHESFQQGVVATNNTNPNTSSTPPGLVEAYFDAWERHSSRGVPFAPTCSRRDNGGVQGNLTCVEQMDGLGIAPNGLYNRTTTVRDRRLLIADEAKGVVLAVAMIDNPATGQAPLPATERIPSTYMVPQLIKVTDGSISRVEGMVKWMPYGYTSAWETSG